MVEELKSLTVFWVFCICIDTKLFTLRVTVLLNKLPRELVEPPSLYIFKTMLDSFLCNLLWGTCISSGVEQGDLQRSPPIQGERVTSSFESCKEKLYQPYPGGTKIWSHDFFILKNALEKLFLCNNPIYYCYFCISIFCILYCALYCTVTSHLFYEEFMYGNQQQFICSMNLICFPIMSSYTANRYLPCNPSFCLHLFCHCLCSRSSHASLDLYW